MKKIVDNFQTDGGKHCITSALKQVCQYHGCLLSEEMIFGIASGLSFMYINLSDSPMVSGRTKPFEFEQKLADRLNITIKCKQTKENKKAFVQVKEMIDRNCPVLIYADMPFMKYLNLDENSHFGAHAVVIFGYDDENQMFYVSDRDHSNYPIRTPRGEIKEDYHLVSYEEIEQARSSNFRPFPANNKYLDFDFSNYKKITPEGVKISIMDTCDSMLHPPAKLLGINGIEKFSKEILKWNKFDLGKLKIAGITNYFQINKDGGTGGGIFRDMYGKFLIEADTILPNQKLVIYGKQWIELAKKWDAVSEVMWELGKTGDKELLEIMGSKIENLYKEEKVLLTAMASSLEK